MEYEGVTNQVKALDEYFLMVLNGVHDFAHFGVNFDRNMAVKGFVIFNGAVSATPLFLFTSGNDKQVP